MTTIAAQLGGKITGVRRTRVEASPQFADGKFRNSVPTSTAMDFAAIRKATADMLTGGLARRRPHQPVPLVTAPAADADGLHVTWYGHSTVLVEIEGHRILLDPVWSERCSPSSLAGPKRLHEPPVPLPELPALDAVVISHDHYDHLDMETVQNLAGLQATVLFVVPLGVGAHLERWGVPQTRIVELDWNESARVGDVELTATPARHFSGRGFTRDETLWASWVIKGPSRRAFYSGDTGYFPGFAEIGERHGPFDVTMVQIGAYGDAWADIHMVPEDGVATHLDVRGGLMIPVHWATFTLAPHAWSEPADRTWREAKARDVTLAIPKPGERIDVDNPPEIDPWWQQIA
ncbi:Zn-dependent hydrolase [Actinoplanes lobatus]|uniref:L-ascorbate metabolism protein UlaG (Beta-lactamase superfamily) n=1 Tax=Actinoplanes lobatus TaxID=113568 RepID=A0A7W7HJK2_9ACTN|nr:MBL fold metallo-hydrolase [Actinoplanes lobatus]MBB4751690.1 L-ascorbate metabolism protein UlaG (beta-lactamase superfamily) [Actinoplanes lobatus]GGN65298.1 Zn-dependent hydrolase [Actinoplanes lobatus]GIE43273.1 Zn-dependent hydrolase [Actinoplanes lobatus]